MKNDQRIFTVGMTGASGAIYGVRLIEELLKANCKVHLVVTESAWQVFEYELKLDARDRSRALEQLFPQKTGQLVYHHLQDFTSAIASGSYQSNGMVVIPCSMGTLAKIANGISTNLLERTADVMLKEGRTLVIVPRETPLNAIHLENMLKIVRAGGKILPAMPGFYHMPATIDDLINFVVGKVLDSLNVEHHLFTRWGDA